MKTFLFYLAALSTLFVNLDEVLFQLLSFHGEVVIIFSYLNSFPVNFGLCVYLSVQRQRHVSFLVYFGLRAICQFSDLYQRRIRGKLFMVEKSAIKDSKSAMIAIFFPSYIPYFLYYINDLL